MTKQWDNDHTVSGRFTPAEIDAVESTFVEALTHLGFTEEDRFNLCNEKSTPTSSKLFTLICERLPSRSPFQLHRFIRSRYAQYKGALGRKWTPQEDKKLWDLHSEHGSKFRVISHEMQRPVQACRTRMSTLKCIMVNSEGELLDIRLGFTMEEDARLLALMKVFFSDGTMFRESVPVTEIGLFFSPKSLSSYSQRWQRIRPDRFRYSNTIENDLILLDKVAENEYSTDELSVNERIRFTALVASVPLSQRVSQMSDNVDAVYSQLEDIMKDKSEGRQLNGDQKLVWKKLYPSSGFDYNRDDMEELANEEVRKFQSIRNEVFSLFDDRRDAPISEYRLFRAKAVKLLQKAGLDIPRVKDEIVEHDRVVNIPKSVKGVAEILEVSFDPEKVRERDIVRAGGEVEAQEDEEESEISDVSSDDE
ncbi:hypothetical protein PCE1_004041 [Barthelona sp. PCE]